MASFEVRVAKEDFKFHAAHFVAFKGYRERLHGHNYKVAVRVLGSRQISPDGYVLDFGDVKKITRKVCKELNEHFLCPMYSNVMDISIVKEEGISSGGKNETLVLSCEDGTFFQIPKQDCALLPIVHSTAEELAIYLWSRILQGLSAQYLLLRGVHTMEITVSEATGQEAVFRLEIPTTTTTTKEDSGESSSLDLDVRTFIMEGELPPAPCLLAASSSEPSNSYNNIKTGNKNDDNNNNGKKDGCIGDGDGNQKCCDSCLASLSQKLEIIASSLRQKSSENNGNLSEVTADDLLTMLKDN